jgi:hypothetical protein
MPVRKQHDVLLPHTAEVVLPDGRRLGPGTRFTVRGERGVFVFRYGYEPDNSIAAYGPEGNGQWRAFAPSRIQTVKRPKVER